MVILLFVEEIFQIVLHYMGITCKIVNKEHKHHYNIKVLMSFNLILIQDLWVQKHEESQKDLHKNSLLK